MPKAGTQPRKTDEQRTAERADRLLNETRKALTNIAPTFTAKIEALALLVSPLRASGNEGGRYSISGVSDPTPAQVQALAKYLAQERRIELWINELHRCARGLEAEMAGVDHDPTLRRGDCSGGLDRIDYEGWEQHCEGFYDRKDGDNARLCGACIRRKNRWREHHP